MTAMLEHWRRWFPRLLDGEQLGPRGQVRMLELTYQRLVLSICAMPLLGIPFTLWFQGLGRNPFGMAAWTALYGLAAVGVLLQARRLHRERRASTAVDAHWLARWRPLVRATSLAHATGLSLLGLIVLLTPGRASYDFVLLLHVGMAVVIVGNATQQLPALGLFLRCYGLGWGIATVLVPLMLTHWPSLLRGGSVHDLSQTSWLPWPVIIPMSLLLFIALYRHAVVAHNFFLHQVRLEEEGVRLAREAEQARAQAEEALQAKNLFLNTASHDLRQPVHAMGFQIESIALRNQDAALLPALEDLRRSVRSVNLMFDSLLDLARIESGAVQVHRQPVALQPLLHDVATLFSEEAISRGLDLRVRLVAGEPTAHADPLLLRQILVNLVHNALRYTARGGVLLGLRRRSEHWQLEVCDTGMGVTSEDQERIFSPFYRHAHAWRMDNAGHGLGLAVVARCAGLMEAAYGLASVQGRGSRFWLRLPVAMPVAPQPAASPATPARSRSGLQGRCLLVEDDPQVVAAWTILMRTWGLETRCAASSAQAFAHLDQGFAPQAIFCDQRLRSGESGFDLLRVLLTRCPDARGAMLSGELHAPELQQAEADGYLVLRKPLDVAALHAVLAQWLRPEGLG